MVSKKEIKKLGELARIELSERELGQTGKDLAGVLEFVSKLKNAPVSETEKEDALLFNVFRDDKGGHKEGEYSGGLLGQAPDTEEGFVKVKKIFNG